MEPGNLIGKTVAGCRLIVSVARGSTGEVFKGVHEALQRSVAVKVVPVASQEKDAVDRLLLEARALAKIEHPNIVHVYDVGVHDGLFYIVMQFLEGTTLKARFEESGAMPVEEVYPVVGGIARGLGAMHDEGLVHRDLKMENVILTTEGRAKIMDFGLVRDSGAKDEYRGRVVGTPPYIPPEIWLGRPPDGRSDLYSLGVILYALLCGVYPFRAKGATEYREQHLKALPKNPVDVVPEIGDDLAAVLLKLLSRDRGRRYGTVAEFLEDFDGCRRGVAPQALKNTGRKIRCGFCESILPAGTKKCTVCHEALDVPAVIGLGDRSKEVPCPSCGEPRDRHSRACPRCGQGICGNCLRGAVVQGGLCAECLAIG
jgi:serine/threonine protein kinase